MPALQERQATGHNRYLGGGTGNWLRGKHRGLDTLQHHHQGEVVRACALC